MHSESYDEGFHRGINPDCHGRNILQMFHEWDQGLETFGPNHGWGCGDPESFAAGYDEGFKAYKEIVGKRRKREAGK